MLTALASGVLLGLASGLAPGPLLALVLAQTLKHGRREGFKVAVSPLITDAPIILLALLVAAKAAEFRQVLGIVSLAGGAFVLYLAWETFRPAAASSEGKAEKPGSWTKGILANLLSPHPWLFWLTVGSATLAKSMAESWLAAAAFLFGFYLLLVGSKLALAVLAAKSRGLLTGQPYVWVMRVLALMLGVFAILLFQEGLKHLDVI